MFLSQKHLGHTFTDTAEAGGRNVSDGPRHSLGPRLMAKTAGSNCTIIHPHFTEGFFRILLWFSSVYTSCIFRIVRNNGKQPSIASQVPSHHHQRTVANTSAPTPTQRRKRTLATCRRRELRFSHVRVELFLQHSRRRFHRFVPFSTPSGATFLCFFLCKPNRGRSGEKIDTQLGCQAPVCSRNRISTYGLLEKVGSLTTHTRTKLQGFARNLNCLFGFVIVSRLLLRTTSISLLH